MNMTKKGLGVLKANARILPGQIVALRAQRKEQAALISERILAATKIELQRRGKA